MRRLRVLIIVQLTALFVACGPSEKSRCPNGRCSAPEDLGVEDLSPSADLSIPSSTNDLAPAPGGELTRCATDGDCDPSLRCRATYKGGRLRCLQPCTQATTCPTGQRCLPDPLGGTTCQISDVGRPCAVANDCAFACLVGQRYCTTTCITGADCPNGYGCQPVGAPAQRVCVKVEAACATGQTSACIAAAACDESPSMIVSGCTIACSSQSDCPQRAEGLAPWTCDAGGICRRPPDVYGPLEQGSSPAQYACNASNTTVNVCNDGQHINFGAFTVPAAPAVNCAASMTTSGAAGDACVNSCRFRGGCAFGFECVAVGSVTAGVRIGLCLPSDGPKEVGAACTSNLECAFGYCTANGKCSRDCTGDGVCPSGSTCVPGGGPPVEGVAFRRCE